MNKALSTCGVALVMSVALIGMPACAKNPYNPAVTPSPLKGRQREIARSPVSAVSPDTGVQSQGGGLRGLDKNPSEERVGSGTMLAKVDPSSSAERQMAEVRAEQAASAAAGLRDVFFGYDSWTISEDGRQALTRDADWMKSNQSALDQGRGAL